MQKNILSIVIDVQLIYSKTVIKNCWKNNFQSSKYILNNLEERNYEN